MEDLTKTKVKSSLLVSDGIECLDLCKMKTANKTGLFYAWFRIWSQYLMLRSGCVRNELSFLGNGSRAVLERYDFGEMKVHNIGMPWMPFFDITNCDSEVRDIGIEKYVYS